MAMKMKTGQLHSAYGVLMEKYKEIGEKQLVGQGPYWVSVLLRKVETHAQPAEEQRMMLVKKLGTPEVKVVDGVEVATGGFKIGAEAMPEFEKAWTQIAGQEVEVDIRPVRQDALAGLTFSVNDYLRLGDLITDPEM